LFLQQAMKLRPVVMARLAVETLDSSKLLHRYKSHIKPFRWV